MNPFQRRAALPAEARGERGFHTAAEALAAAQAKGEQSFAVLSAPRGMHLLGLQIALKEEFAWVAPAKTYMVRAGEAILAGIKLVEMHDA